jgi:hypothetical protein
MSHKSPTHDHANRPDRLKLTVSAVRPALTAQNHHYEPFTTLIFRTPASDRRREIPQKGSQRQGGTNILTATVSSHTLARRF